jgi:predicted transcriptional regulator
MSSPPVSVRLPAALAERLARLAASTGRSRCGGITAALDAYLDLSDWQTAAIAAALADERPNLAHDAVVARNARRPR